VAGGRAGGAVSCAMAGGPATMPAVNTMAEITRGVPRRFSRSDIEEITLIIRAHSLFEENAAGI
jgi:hypothetical protein